MKEFFKGLSWVQLVAGAGAAVTSLLLSTRIGISGSLIGAAVASVVSAVSSQVYKNVLNTSTKKIKQGMGLAEEEEQATRPTDAASAPRALSDERAGQHVGWWEREQGVAGQTQAAGGAPADGTVAQWDAATVRMQAQTARGAHAQAPTSPLADVPAWGVPQATDEQDAAAALHSFDAPIDPTVAGMGAVGVAGAAQAGRSTDAALPDRTMRMPATCGHSTVPAGVGTDASAYSRSTYAARVRGGRVAASERSPYGTAATGEAWGSPACPARAEATRGKRRGQVLGAAVAFLSALAAVIVCAVVISVATSGKGLGYKPASTWLPAPAEQTADSADTATDAAKSAVADAVSSLVQGAAQVAGTAASAVTDAVTSVTGTTTTEGSATTTSGAGAATPGAGTGADAGTGGTEAGGETPDAGAGTGAGGVTDAGTDAGTGAGATDAAGTGAAAGDTTTTSGTDAADGADGAADAGADAGEAAAA